jgi:predicted HAD superfamily Cof-like phosphohydrolase
MTKEELKIRLESLFQLKDNILWQELLYMIPESKVGKSGAVTKVEEFHRAFGHPIIVSPQFPREERCHLRKKLILEEASEFVNAVNERDMVEVADAICDLLYVVYGAAIEFGLGDILKEMFAEVHRSNMSKLGEDGKPITRMDGKTIKGPNFSPPNLGKIIARVTQQHNERKGIL